jgi:NADH:ubiquinone oxidoreductase subunit 6 (subunit J)
VLTLAQQIIEPVEPVMFYCFAALVCLSAIGVLVSQQIVRQALWLLGTLVGVAALYFLMYAELMAAVQLIVYAGGTLILIVFGIMLTTKNPFARIEVSKAELVTGIAAGAITVGILIAVFAQWAIPTAPVAEVAAIQQYSVAAIGRVLLSKYLIPFEVAGVLLLIVMIAAAYMAKGRRGAMDERS